MNQPQVKVIIFECSVYVTASVLNSHILNLDTTVKRQPTYSFVFSSMCILCNICCIFVIEFRND